MNNDYIKYYNKYIDIRILLIILLVSSINLKAINTDSCLNSKVVFYRTPLYYLHGSVLFIKEFGMNKSKQKERYEKNKESIKLKRKKYYQDNKERIAEWKRNNYQKKKEYIKAREKAYSQTERGRILQNASKKRHIEKYPEKHQARLEVKKALLRGDLIKGKCEVCDNKKVQAHHDDYNKPLDVRWFCSQHHSDLRSKVC